MPAPATSCPVRVAVTGAAGHIGYSLLIRIAAGEMLGKEQPVQLQLLEIPQAEAAMRGVAMELEDCAFPLLQHIVCTTDVHKAFEGADYALLVGARPRGPGMERSDLLQANAAIFTAQGEAINRTASRDVRVLVVGNPANTNALLTLRSAPDIPSCQFTAMTRLDHNRALAQLALKTSSPVGDIRRVTIWGNHSTTQYPDLHHALVEERPALECIPESWYREHYIPTVQKRGAAVIKARGASSAASAAAAAIAHMRDWVQGTPAGDWTSMGVPSDGSYGIDEGLLYSFPVRCQDREWKIVPDLEIGAFSRQMIERSAAELRAERHAVEKLFG